MLLVQELFNIAVNDFDVRKFARYSCALVVTELVFFKYDSVLIITLGPSQNQLKDTIEIAHCWSKNIAPCNRMLVLTEPKLDPMFMFNVKLDVDYASLFDNLPEV